MNQFDHRKLAENRELERILMGLQTDFSEDRLNEFTNALILRGLSGGELLVPMLVREDVQAPGDVQAPEETEDAARCQVAYQSLTGDGEDEWIPAFTSEEEADKGERAELTQIGILDFLDFFTNLEGGLTGIVFNPWGNQLLMPRDIVESILDAVEEFMNSIDDLDLSDEDLRELGIDFSDPDDEEDFSDVTADGAVDLVLGDITELSADCIVNAANNTLMDGGGVNGAIHQAAGPELDEACRSLRGCGTGKAKITDGFRLPAKKIIHTVGPIYSGSEEDARLLADCYWNSLDLAAENDLHSIVFPCISTGIFGYPKDAAARIAVETTVDWMDSRVTDYPMKIMFCVHEEDDYDRYEAILDEILGDAE